MGNQYSNLSFEERKMIEKLYKNGISIREIAKQLNRGQSTISREFSRNGQDDDYDAIVAQARANLKRKTRNYMREQALKNKEIVQKYIHEHPEALLEEVMNATKLSKGTVYKYWRMLEQEKGEVLLKES